MGEVNGKHFIHKKLFFLNSSQLFFYAFTMAGQAAGELPLESDRLDINELLLSAV
jgi:hypothetical protein